MVSPSNNLTDKDIAAAPANRAGRRAAAAVTTLNALAHGAEARVVSVEGEGAVARRLMEMGVVPGAPVCVIKAAPLGDPIEVRVRGYHLALRRAEAQTIQVVTGDR
jgi:ferrous iron transport protein A